MPNFVRDDGTGREKFVLIGGKYAMADLFRFIRFVRPQDGGCWSWAGDVDRKGYAEFWFGNDKGRAMHFILEVAGRPILEGEEPDHLCRNTNCVNPDHLEVVSRRINLLRGDSPVGINARKFHCKHGHVFDAENTYYTKEGHRNCRTCARERARAVYRANPQKFVERARSYRAR